ncbi:MAG: redoxin domain-containing protein [Planctomycetia bacterium]|nr:redoxin domain-containing protein [Planctomycetia bacterium]
MQKHLEEIRSLGAKLIVVTQSKPQNLIVWLEDNPKPFPVVCDPERMTYKALGLQPGSVWMFLSPKVLGSYFSHMFRGWRIRRPVKQEDLLQLGGDFIVDRSRKLIYAHRSTDPSDRPTVTDIMLALRRSQ